MDAKTTRLVAGLIGLVALVALISATVLYAMDGERDIAAFTGLSGAGLGYLAGLLNGTAIGSRRVT